jgi:hypothetical protein
MAFLLALTLLVTRVAFANNHHVAVTAYYAAVLTNGLNTGFYLHDVSF